MNYFKSFLLTAFALFALASCDTDDLKDDINDLKGRVESLEAQVGLLNENMTAIKRLLEGGQTITELSETNGTYTLKLSNGETITLTQGSEGEVKYPEITVNSEGQWVVNGEVLKQSGTPVQAVGKPGNDGITPKFRITDEGSFWQVSYDGGETWEDVHDVNGNKVSAVSNGSGGGSSADTFFEEVGKDATGDFFVIKLKGEAEEISIPIVKDVLCEIIKPTAEMKNGYWEIGYGKTVSTDIKVKGDDIIATAPAGWVVTVSDIDAEKNTAKLTITAPASAVTTRATADNSSDVTVQVNKGANWAVDKIQVKAVEIIDSYYALYNSGKTFTVNGIEVNNEKFGDATYIESDQTINTPGVYFIKGGVTVKYNGSTNAANLIFIGDDSQKSSTVAITGSYVRLRQSTETGHFLCKNIIFKADEGFTNYLFTVYADESFANVAFDKCQIILLASKPLSAITNDKRSITNLSIENCVFKLAASTQQFIINTSENKNLDYGNVTFRNNIFYCPSDRITQFFIINGKNTGIANLILENNTFINMVSNTSGYITIGTLNKISVSKNIFWSDKTKGDDKNAVIMRFYATAPTGDYCSENILYKTMDNTWQMFYAGKAPFAEAEDFTPLSKNPFDGGTFDLANGIFIPSAEYSEYGASIN